MSSTNSRIAKNTLSLYVRLFITLGVSLYTSRIILQELGASDYGLYNVVGGIVILLGFLNRTMTSSTQRFLNFEKGKRNIERLKKIFGTSVYIHIIIAIAIFVLAETLGLWMLNSWLNIDPSKMKDANWVYQCSILTFIVSILSVPYNAAIIANEKMSAFAYISILEVSLKLAIVFLLQLSKSNKLILYAILTLSVTLIIRIVYSQYSKRNFEECRGKLKIDKSIFREILSFSSWTILSNLSVALRTQGISVVLNIFFGTIINAAQGIATQINSIITNFVLSFTQAVNPQIVKNFAAGELDKMRSLVIHGAKLSFFLLLLFALPVLINTDFILHLWLKKVPEFTATFVRLTLILALVDSFSNVMATSQGATGKVKKYHITMSVIGLMTVPISFLILKLGAKPYSTLFISIAISVTLCYARLVFLERSIQLPIQVFFKKVVFKCILVTISASFIPLFLHFYLPETVWAGLFICAITGICVIFCILYIGMTAHERVSIISEFKKIINKKIKRK